MAKQQKPYQKLSKNRFALFYANSLWQGRDHLLRVEAGMMTEHYKRFYFKDIQAVVLHRTAKYLYLNFTWGLLALASALAFLVHLLPQGVVLPFIILFLVLLGGNLVLGPSCEVRLQTAVQVEKLPALKRIKKAQKVMNRIRGAVIRIQGPLDLDTLNQPDFGGNTSPQVDQLVFHQPPGSKAALSPLARAREPFHPLGHRVLFTLFLAGGICSGLRLWFPATALVIVEHLLLVSALVLVIITLVRWYHQIKGRALAVVTWLGLILVILQCLMDYGIYMIASFRNPQMAYNNWAMLSAYFNLQRSDFTLRLILNGIFAVGNLVLGGMGILILTRHLPQGKRRL